MRNAPAAGRGVSHCHPIDMPHPHELAPDFDRLRQWRSAHYQGWDPTRAPRRRRAVVTIVRDEAELLPIWLGYYSRFFAADDIYVIDHDTVDGSTSGPGFVRIPVSHPEYDVHWLMAQVRDVQHELCQRYDVVVVCDVDEIVAPDPSSATPDLGAYLDRFDEEFVSCVGHEVLHRPDLEPPIDLARPLLAQRGWWYRSPLYDKPLVTSRADGLGAGYASSCRRGEQLRPRSVAHPPAPARRRALLRTAPADGGVATRRPRHRGGTRLANRIRERADFDHWFHNRPRRHLHAAGRGDRPSLALGGLNERRAQPGMVMAGSTTGLMRSPASRPMRR